MPRDEWRLVQALAEDAIDPLFRHTSGKLIASEIGAVVSPSNHRPAICGAVDVREGRLGSDRYFYGRRIAVEPYVIGAAVMQALTEDYAALDREYNERNRIIPGGVTITLPVFTVEQLANDVAEVIDDLANGANS